MGDIAEDFLNFEDWLELTRDESQAVREELEDRGVTQAVVNALFHFDAHAWQAEATRRTEFLKDFPNMPDALIAAHTRFLKQAVSSQASLYLVLSELSAHDVIRLTSILHRYLYLS